jgi:putative nucleotidyltransferase with HDIG domain
MLARMKTGATAGGLAATLLGLSVGIVAALALMPVSLGGADVREGDRAPRAYRAQHAAQYESDILTEQFREEAASGVADVYLPPDATIRARQEQALTQFLDALAVLRDSNMSAAEKLAEAAALPGGAVVSEPVLAAILTLDDVAFADFRDRAGQALTAILEHPDGVLADEASGKVNNFLEADPPADASVFVALREVLNAFVVQNVEVDEAETERARDAARAEVEPAIVTWAQGQLVAQEGQTLDADDIEALQETGIISPGFDGYRALGGLVVAAGAALLIGGGAFTVASFERPAGRKLTLIGVAIVAALLVARLGFPAIFPDRERLFIAFALPIATVALLCSVLAGFSFAAIVSVTLGLTVTFVATTVPELPGSRFAGPLEAFELATALVVAGIAGAPILARSHGVLRYAGAGVAASVAVGGVLGAGWLFSEPRADSDLGWMGTAAAIHGVGSALLAGGVIAIGGRWLGVEAPNRLTALTRGDHPLLRQLQDEAPGTYHHSMMVATLAEAAARRIGADAGLARVGAMFHDVGKLAQPRYYIENTLEGEPSVHGSLSPEDSAARIREHVANGLVIARRAGLPPEIERFIPEHHGTRLIAYFYREAVRESPVVDMEAFRYAGPKPQSRETAIVMLADSCEATVRANQSNDGDGIDLTVDTIINERMDEGELDESGLAVADIRLIAAVFKESLKALHHRRIPYPPALTGELAGLLRG